MQQTILRKFYEQIKKQEREEETSDTPYEKREKVQEIQRDKFSFISSLVSKLFSSKNSKDEYHTVSNLILASLHSFNSVAVDDFHTDKIKTFSNNTGIFHQILDEELDDVYEEFQKYQSVGIEFRNILKRFLEQYDDVENYLFPPKNKKID